ncbi:hypothetical protein PR003_g32414, partial [Phytophthora rubi]
RPTRTSWRSATWCAACCQGALECAAGHDVTCGVTPLTHAELGAQVTDYDVLIVRSGSRVDRTVLDAAQKL